jgi:ribosome maturation factor RimP
MTGQTALQQSITAAAERVAASEGLELVEVVLRGSGASRLLRVVIDKPEGVSLNDCETVSRQLGAILDVEELVPGGRYQLEVSSPGIERKLFRPKDFQRFVGRPIKVTLHDAREGRKTFEGTLAGFAEDVVQLALPTGEALSLTLQEISRANLKYDWGQPTKPSS